MTNEGERAPQVVLKDQNGKMVNTSDLVGEGWLVIYFYPKDETPGCTAQACTFRDHYEDLTDAGATVVGISSDSVESHGNFALHHNLPFILLSDTEGEARKAFGVPRSMGLLPGRVTYVIDREGIVRMIFNSQMRAAEHVKKVLDFIGNKKR
jgi:peroxiredoxin Q/BCP